MKDTRKATRGAPWTPEQEEQLRAMVEAGVGLTEIAKALGRTISAIGSRCQVLDLRKPATAPFIAAGFPRPAGLSADAARWARRTFRPAEFRRDMTGDQGEAAMILAFLRDPAAKGAAA